jgi:aspartate aminotransferase
MFEQGAAMKAEHGEKNVFDFSLGNPDLPPPADFHRVLMEELRQDPPRMHSYMPNGGYPFARDEVASYLKNIHGTGIDGSRVILTNGAGGALNVALKSVLNPGDTVLVSTPCFMEYMFYTANHGGKLELVARADDFSPDIAAFEERIGPETAAVIINSPNNPSGRIYPEETLRELGGLLTKKSAEYGRTIYLISDEPYRKLVYDGAVVPSVFQAYPESIITTSFSKDLSIPGERIGYLALHPEAASGDELMNAFILCNRILGYVNAPALMQRAVVRLLESKVDVDRYQRRRDLLCDGLADIGFRFRKPEGAFYLFPQAPGGDDLEAVRVLQNERILTVPGRGFGSPGFFRIAFCVEEEVIEGAMPGFKRAFTALTGG